MKEEVKGLWCLIKDVHGNIVPKHICRIPHLNPSEKSNVASGQLFCFSSESQPFAFTLQGVSLPGKVHSQKLITKRSVVFVSIVQSSFFLCDSLKLGESHLCVWGGHSGHWSFCQIQTFYWTTTFTSSGFLSKCCSDTPCGFCLNSKLLTLGGCVQVCCFSGCVSCQDLVISCWDISLSSSSVIVIMQNVFAL